MVGGTDQPGTSEAARGTPRPAGGKRFRIPPGLPLNFTHREGSPRPSLQDSLKSKQRSPLSPAQDLLFLFLLIFLPFC